MHFFKENIKLICKRYMFQGENVPGTIIKKNKKVCEIKI